VKLYGTEEANFKVTVKPLEIKEEAVEEAKEEPKKASEAETSEAAVETESAQS
jgi:hypothetical protein